MSDIADIIRIHRDTILERWRIEAQRTASARGLTQPEFMNIMPVYVASLAELDAGRTDEVREKLDRLVGDHLASRLRQGFDLQEILAEFSILARELAAVAATLQSVEQGPPPDLGELFAELDRSSKLVAHLFTQHMQEDEQTEKRYLRLLQNIASETLTGQTAGPVFRQRLTEVLDLIMEATGTQSAAILLYEPESRELRHAASAGRGSEGLEHYAVSLGASSFEGLVVAAPRETTAVMDVVTTPLEVSDTVRQSGIHSLLGVRLCTHNTLLGVLYVGLVEQRPFAIRDTRRLEAFAERLALHLENARLYAELNSSIDELRMERELRSRFVAMLAHDLGGALATVMMNMQLLIRAPDALQVVRRASASYKTLLRIDRMRSDLLDVERLRAGRPLPLDLEQVDLGEIAREVAADMIELHPDRVVVNAAEGIQGMWSADLLRRTLWNLVTNGFKYGAADTPVDITVRRAEGGAELSVHNEGPPIPEGARARIFEPFAQLQSGGPSGVHGWGLGLVLVKACAEAHGGTIELDSAPGRGTTFTLKIPWAVPQPAA